MSDEVHEWLEAQRTAVEVRCSALQCVAVHCNALQCIAVRCSTLQCVAAQRIVDSSRPTKETQSASDLVYMFCCRDIVIEIGLYHDAHQCTERIRAHVIDTHLICAAIFIQLRLFSR